MKQFRGTIKNWREVEYYKGCFHVVGEPCEDNPFYPHNKYMHTSRIVAFNEDRTEVETLNSIYKLQDERK